MERKATPPNKYVTGTWGGSRSVYIYALHTATTHTHTRRGELLLFTLFVIVAGISTPLKPRIVVRHKGHLGFMRMTLSPQLLHRHR